MTDELSIDDGEVTDKGSINPRKMAANRAELIEQLYRQSESFGGIVVRNHALPGNA